MTANVRLRREGCGQLCFPMVLAGVFFLWRFRAAKNT
jgi:hypothetical protein